MRSSAPSSLIGCTPKLKGCRIGAMRASTPPSCWRQTTSNTQSTRPLSQNSATTSLATRRMCPVCPKVTFIVYWLNFEDFWLQKNQIFGLWKNWSLWISKNLRFLQFKKLTKILLEMSNLSLTDSNSDTDTCRSLNMLPGPSRRRQTTPTASTKTLTVRNFFRIKIKSYWINLLISRKKVLK